MDGGISDSIFGDFADDISERPSAQFGSRGAVLGMIGCGEEA
jgi:hypothetical protein